MRTSLLKVSVASVMVAAMALVGCGGVDQGGGSGDLGSMVAGARGAPGGGGGGGGGKPPPLPPFGTTPAAPIAGTWTCPVGTTGGTLTVAANIDHVQRAIFVTVTGDKLAAGTSVFALLTEPTAPAAPPLALSGVVDANGKLLAQQVFRTGAQTVLLFDAQSNLCTLVRQ